MPILLKHFLELQAKLIDDLPATSVVEFTSLDRLRHLSIYSALAAAQLPGIIDVWWNWSDGDIVRSMLLPNSDTTVIRLKNTPDLRLSDPSMLTSYQGLIVEINNHHSRLTVK